MHAVFDRVVSYIVAVAIVVAAAVIVVVVIHQHNIMPSSIHIL